MMKLEIYFKDVHEASLFISLVSDFKEMLQDMSDAYGFESDHCIDVLEDGWKQLWDQISFDVLVDVMEQENNRGH